MELVKVEHRGRGIGKISWAHPLLAMHFARWVSIDFEFALIDLYHRYASGDRSLAKEVADIADNNEMTVTVSTTTIFAKSTPFTDIAAMHGERNQHHVAELEINQQSDDRHFLQSVVTVDPSTSKGRIESKWVQKSNIADKWRAAEGKISPTSSVYFARMKGTVLVKIGYSANVFERLCTLQTACPLDIVIEMVYPTPMYKVYERALHLHLAAFRVRGEWFALPIDADYTSYINACGILSFTKPSKNI